MSTEFIQQVRVLDPIAQSDRVADVLLVDGQIQAIAPDLPNIPSEAQRIDGQGCVLGPGLVDLYSRSGEPGHEERETLASLQAAAIAGGFTRVSILPTTTPVIDTPAQVAWLAEQTQGRVACWGALTQGAQGEQMTELAELADSGVVGFADGRSLSNSALIRRALEYAQPLGKPIALWPCDTALMGNGLMREGEAALKFGLPDVPLVAETAAIAFLLECIDAIRTPVHLMRISTARGVELIAAAKARGVPVTASTTWMHLLFNSDDLATYDPNLRLNPPVGNLSDQQALIQAIQSGVMDAIAIDHAAYTYEEKTVAFSEAPAGVIGLEIALPLLWSELVESGKLSAWELWRSLSVGPLTCLHQPPIRVEADQRAELTLFNPKAPWVLDSTSSHSRSQNTPWWGKEIPGRVVQCWR